MGMLDVIQGPASRGDCGPSFARVVIHIAMTVNLLAGSRDGQRVSFA
jgi:hypothetical protein